jgi:hypothetical protein
MPDFDILQLDDTAGCLRTACLFGTAMLHSRQATAQQQA